MQYFTDFNVDRFSKAEHQLRRPLLGICWDRVHTFVSFCTLCVCHYVILKLVQSMLIAFRCSFNQFRKRLKISSHSQLNIMADTISLHEIWRLSLSVRIFFKFWQPTVSLNKTYHSFIWGMHHHSPALEHTVTHDSIVHFLFHYYANL